MKQKATDRLIQEVANLLDRSGGDVNLSMQTHYLESTKVLALLAIAQELKRANDRQETKEIAAMNAGASKGWGDEIPWQDEPEPETWTCPTCEQEQPFGDPCWDCIERAELGKEAMDQARDYELNNEPPF